MSDLDHHVSYEHTMMMSTHALLQEGFAFGGDRAQFYKNVFHESWCIHVYNLLVYFRTDYRDMKRRIEEQILTLTTKRSMPDDKDRILTPDFDTTAFVAGLFIETTEK